MRTYDVERGGDEDVCLLCGIYRRNAGYTEMTCGGGFRTDGCFVAPISAEENQRLPEQTTGAE